MSAADESGPPTSAMSDALKVVHNETIKLRATTINAIAIALFIAAGVAPLAGAATNGITMPQIILGCIWTVIGFALHSVAQRVLRRLVP